MNRKKFLSKILCLGAVAAIAPKIIPIKTSVHGKVDGTLYYTDNYSPEEVLRIHRETSNILYKPFINKFTIMTTKKKTKTAKKPCPGSKKRSGGRGRGLGIGKKKGPIGRMRK